VCTRPSGPWAKQQTKRTLIRYHHKPINTSLFSQIILAFHSSHKHHVRGIYQFDFIATYKYDLQSPDEIKDKSLRSSDGSRTCEDFLSAAQMWLNKIQVGIIVFLRFYSLLMFRFKQRKLRSLRSPLAVSHLSKCLGYYNFTSINATCYWLSGEE